MGVAYIWGVVCQHTYGLEVLLILLGVQYQQECPCYQSRRPSNGGFAESGERVGGANRGLQDSGDLDFHLVHILRPASIPRPAGLANWPAQTLWISYILICQFISLSEQLSGVEVLLGDGGDEIKQLHDDLSQLITLTEGT